MSILVSTEAVSNHRSPPTRSCLPLFLRELGRSPLAAVRNNILITLSDLCVRYTALVDSHVLRISACIRDPCELVRRHALALLASLLQRDYLKWKGTLFLRFCTALADEAPAVRQLCAALLRDPQLAPRVPLLAYNHFQEALFVLNGAAPPAAEGGVRCGAGREVPSCRLSVFLVPSPCGGVAVPLTR